ncbi:hypothetical protein GCM10018791_71730 [Streptomyces zaomyceticus]|nr:hypothetical protein GCM10018791_71730 [Streptomyces zaomyceticus]
MTMPEGPERVLPELVGRDMFDAVVIRTEFSDGESWNAVVGELCRPWGPDDELPARVRVVDAPAWSGATADEVLAAVDEDEYPGLSVAATVHGPRLGVVPHAERAQPLIVDGGRSAAASGVPRTRRGVWGGVRLAVRKPWWARQERTDQRDWAESREPVLSQEAVERRERAEPIEPADRTLPTEPIERTLPTEPMDSTDPTEPMESIDSFEPIERNDPRGRGRVMGPSCQVGWAGWGIRLGTVGTARMTARSLRASVAFRLCGWPVMAPAHALRRARRVALRDVSGSVQVRCGKGISSAGSARQEVPGGCPAGEHRSGPTGLILVLPKE